MKTNEIMKSVSGTVHKVGFKLQKKSPEILVAVGIIGVVTSAVMACKATTKAGKLMEETKGLWTTSMRLRSPALPRRARPIPRTTARRI